MRVRFTMRLLLCLALLGIFDGVSTRAQAAEGFTLRSGDHVVFYGDSITEQSFYTRWIELYTATRFPSLHVLFYNAGVGGDRVTGGAGGPIDERLARDVFSHQPTVVTIMLGMNDGSYVPLTPAIEETYSKGYVHILDSLRTHAPTARLTLIGPSPFDEVTRPKPLFSGGYNATLLRFGQIDKELAARFGGSFTDANRPFTAALQRALAQDTLAAQMLVPDRVHPANPAHLLIAAAVLRAWHAPSLVSDTELDLGTLSSAESRSVHVSDLASHEGALSWTSLESALPVPFEPNDAALGFALPVTGFNDEFNQERLRVRGLAPGSYQLTIDGDRVAAFSATELAAGVNIASMRTPMRQQAQSIEWAIRDRDYLQFVRLRMQVKHATAVAVEALTPTEELIQSEIWAQAVPKPHHFTLVPEAASAASGQ